MDSHTDTYDFLQAVFGDGCGTAAIYANLEPPFHTRDWTKLDPSRSCYWSVGEFPDDDSTTRTNARALAVRALVIDDVGTKVPEGAVRLALGNPTAIVETSTGNYQWAYRLASAVPVADWATFFAAVEALVGQKLEGRDAVHLFRLPMGVNTKPSRGMFKVRLVAVNELMELECETIVSHSTPLGATSAGPGPSGPTAPTPRISNIKNLLDLLPNPDVDYDAWIARAHQVKALALDEEEGWEAFDAWSAKSAKYDPAETRRRWDTVRVTRTAGLTLLADAEAADPGGFTKTMNAEAGAAFDDGQDMSWAGPPPGASKGPGITATPYAWVAPSKIPLREWLYGDLLIRKFISMTVAPGGVGKSSLVAVETLAQVTGKALLGEAPPEPLRVWLWNLEDPAEETARKIQAAALHYGVTEADIGGRLFVDSGRDQRLVVAEMSKQGPIIVRPVVEALVAEIRRYAIDVVVIDPFVSCHSVPENDNTAQDMVVKEWGRVAELGGCAVHLVDHTRKAGADAEVTTESSRGGKAKTDAARVVRVVNRMTAGDGRAWGIRDTWRYFNTFNDKANMAPPKGVRDWYWLASVPLGNGGGAAGAFSVGAAAVGGHGDSVGVATQWAPPSPQTIAASADFQAMKAAMGTEKWRADPQSKEKWIGNAAAKALNLDPKKVAQRAPLVLVVKQWIKEGLLKEVAQMDEHRKNRIFIEIAAEF